MRLNVTARILKTRAAPTHVGRNARELHAGAMNARAPSPVNSAHRLRFAGMKLFGFLVALTVWTAGAPAQIDPGGIANPASFRLAALPDSGVAQGSIITVFSLQARNIGPADALLAETLPLPTELGGVSIQVTVGGLTVDCPLLFVSATQVSAVLPSDTLAGSGELRLMVGAQTYSEPITVQRSAFGIFTQNQAGTGAAAVQNFTDAFSSTPVNTPIQSINPGGGAILWGTGLGRVQGDPAEACPFPCETDTTVEIFVGGVKVTTILYAGRSPQFAGLDQINFIVPPGAVGCYVPVVVVVDGVPSNYPTISIAESGAVCSEPDGFTAEELQQFLSDGQLRTGSVTVSRIQARVESGGIVEDLVLDRGLGAFVSYPSQTFHTAAPPLEFVSLGACRVYSFQNAGTEFEDPVPPTGLDAGPQLMLRGPGGARTVSRMANGRYSAVLHARGDPQVPGAPRDPYVLPGSHVLSGLGGTDVGALEALGDLGMPLTWTNREQFANVNKSDGLTVTWSGGDPINERVRIFGASLLGSRSNAVGAAFVCRADVAAGSFTVGPEVLRPLPDSDPGGLSGFLRVGTSAKPVRFSASGLDAGWFTIEVMRSQIVDYE